MKGQKLQPINGGVYHLHPFSEAVNPIAMQENAVG